MRNISGGLLWRLRRLLVCGCDRSLGGSPLPGRVVAASPPSPHRRMQAAPHPQSGPPATCPVRKVGYSFNIKQLRIYRSFACRYFLCGIHPSLCKENAGQRSFGVLKTSFSILKTRFSFLKASFTNFEDSSLLGRISRFMFKTVDFCLFPKIFDNKNGIKFL